MDEQLRQRFNRAFAHWGIELPVDAMSSGVVWLIAQRGWTIWTCFDIGAEDGRERLDYYAMHRMTSDRHVRLYADGEEEGLPAMSEGYVIPQAATVAERQAVRDKHFAYNQAVGEAAGREGLCHDGSSPRQRPHQPLSADPPGRGGPPLNARHDVNPAQARSRRGIVRLNGLEPGSKVS